MKYKYKDHYNREYNFLVRARFNSVDNAKQFMWDNEDFQCEQERHAEDWLYFYVRNKTELLKLLNLLASEQNAESFDVMK